MNCEKYLLLNVKKLLIFVGGFILAVILHNMFYAFTGIEEAVFFMIAVFVIPIWFLIAVGYTIFHHVKKRKK